MEEPGILDSGSSPWRHTPLQGARNDQRFSDRLGGCLVVQGCSRLVGSPTAVPTHKCVRTSGGFPCPQAPLSAAVGEARAHKNRQHSSGLPHKPSREYEVSVIPETSSPVAVLGLPPLAEPESHAHSRHLEHGSRLVPTEPSSWGVGAATGGGAGHLAAVRQSRGRSLRLPRLYTLPSMVFPGRNNETLRPGRAGTRVAPAAFVCISSTSTDLSHSPQDLPGRPHGTADSPQMAREAVVSRVAQTIGQTALAPPHSCRPPFTTGGTNLAPESGTPTVMGMATEGPEPLLGTCDTCSRLHHQQLTGGFH